MFTNHPKLGEDLTQDHINFLATFAKSCRKSIVEMVTNAQSGHPGGSLSTIDYLTVLYTLILGQTGEKLVVSNGHISPAVYSVLGEMGYVDKKEAVENFRQLGSKFEGHITRHVDGVDFGTGPLGVGVSVGAAFALAEKMKKTDRKAYCVMGDGEVQEGQVHEMIHFARHYDLNNLILFVDYNKVQLTASIEETLKIDIQKVFEAGHWHVINVNGHDYQSLWNAISEAHEITCKPVVLIGDTIMGQGVEYMQREGEELRSTWHGKAPAPEEIQADIDNLTPTEEEEKMLEEFRNHLEWKPTPAQFPKLLSKVEGIDEGSPIVYEADEKTDCRTAYGKALLDLANHNKEVLALTADLQGSVMTKFVASDLPDQYIECGIAEQHMVSCAGGLSLSGFVPFCSTFGAFLTSRPKDQARVNDINHCNVKMVATHCGLSVGEDGPTHQAIDDAGAMLGHYNTMIIEPADPNQTDRIIRYITSHYGNFYVRMGRHKFPNITKEDGTLFYDKDYKYVYGKSDVIRKGSDITIAATGAMVGHAIQAADELKNKLSIEVVAVSSIKKFDETLTDSIKKTKRIITVEDHNNMTGLGGQLARHLTMNGIILDRFKMLSPTEYQLSGKSDDLYHHVGIDSEGIKKACENL